MLGRIRFQVSNFTLNRYIKRYQENGGWRPPCLQRLVELSPHDLSVSKSFTGEEQIFVRTILIIASLIDLACASPI